MAVSDVWQRLLGHSAWVPGCAGVHQESMTGATRIEAGSQVQPALLMLVTVRMQPLLTLLDKVLVETIVTVPLVGVMTEAAL